jgi:hypothetical protein
VRPLRLFKAYGREKVGKGTLRPPQNCSHKYYISTFGFYVNINIKFWIIFVCLKYIGLDLDLRQSFRKKTPTNISELQHLKYIGDEIIFVTKYEKLHTYFKTKVVGGIFW